MNVTPTKFEGLVIIEPSIWKDDRGYFYESYNQVTWQEHLPETTFVQDNQAASTRGVLRGLHFQKGAHAQAKLVRVTHGEVQDVVVDLRKNQPTYGKWFSIRLSAANHRQLFVPRGFAHGYLTISQKAIFQYKCDNFYNKAAEDGIKYDDPTLGIEWALESAQFIISPKDQQLPHFEP